MSLRRDTTNRLTLYRSCGTCDRTFTTTADSPFMRKISGKTVYYCSVSCKKASYKGRRTGDRRDYWKTYYQAHRDKKLAQMTTYYYDNRDDINQFRRKAKVSA